MQKAPDIFRKVARWEWTSVSPCAKIKYPEIASPEKHRRFFIMRQMKERPGKKMNRKEYELLQNQQRDELFEAAERYKDRPHSYRGNLIRIRMCGGSSNTLLGNIMLLVCIAFCIWVFWLSFRDAPRPREDIREETFTLASFSLRGGRSQYRLTSEDGKIYRTNILCYSFLYSKGIELLCKEGALITVGVDIPQSTPDSAFCDTISIDGTSIMDYDEYCQCVEKNRQVGFCFSGILLAILLLLKLLAIIAVMNLDNISPKHTKWYFHTAQIPSTWPEIYQRELHAYQKRHSNDSKGLMI